MVTLAVMAGLVGAVGAAGFLRDRLKGRRRPEPFNGAGADDPTLRYYSDVRRSHENHGFFGGRPL
jgi:hypothetical protein